MEGPARTSARPARTELVSLAERMRSMGFVRGGLVLVALVFGVLAPRGGEVPPAELTLGSAAYLLLLLVPWLLTPFAIARRSRRAARWIVGGSLLVDGVYLGLITYATGGAQSPLRFLILVHVVAVSLLASYRTGLKIAAWHSLVYVVSLYAQAAELIAVREGLASALPGGADFSSSALLNIGAVWIVALGTAACSALNERELRAQKIDLEQLSAMVREMEQAPGAAEIPEVLLDALCRVFGFRRGVVLASPEGNLSLMAHRGIDAGDPPGMREGLDRSIERAWDDRRTQLVSAFDPDADPRLAALLPDARNVLVVPLFVDRGLRLGVVALEHPARRDRVKRWVVTLVEQFASHTALALRNAWLIDELEQKLDENRSLQQQLIGQNLNLELKVAERTEDLSQSLQNLRVSDEQRRLLLERLVHAEEEERKRIAGDIHDDPVQKMVAASMRIQLLRKALTDPDQLEDADKLLSVIRGSIDSMRTMIFELRPHALDQDGLGPALREYLESLDAGFEFEIDDRLSDEPPAELRVILYRMAQEALANANKHAGADTVRVVLEERDGGFLVQIADDGAGFSPPGTFQSAPGHLGLSSMRERAEMAGGWCQLHSLPGEGTTVEFWAPGPPAAPPETSEEDEAAISMEDEPEVIDPAPAAVGGAS